jgi:hypothetical protein
MSGVDTQNSNLVSELMKQINSSDLYNEPQYRNDYNDEVMQDNSAERPEVQELEQENNFNPEDLIPPPKEDDVEQKGYAQDEEYTDEEEELYYRDDMSETLKYANREYTSFVMETVKTAIILFIGYIIFSHPLTGFYISNFFSNFPGFVSLMSITTYKLALHGSLFVLFYFIVMYVF